MLVLLFESLTTPESTNRDKELMNGGWLKTKKKNNYVNSLVTTLDENEEREIKKGIR